MTDEETGDSPPPDEQSRFARYAAHRAATAAYRPLRDGLGLTPTRSTWCRWSCGNAAGRNR